MEPYILEPCCFVKQLTAWMPNSIASTLNLFTYGDLPLSKLLPYLVRRGAIHSSVDVVLCLPKIEQSTLDTVAMLKKETFGRQDGSLYPLIGKCDYISRDVSLVMEQGLADDESAVLTKNLCLQSVLISADSDTYITLYGGIVQEVSAGPHMLTLSTDVKVFDSIMPFLKMQMHTHKVVVNNE